MPEKRYCLKERMEFYNKVVRFGPRQAAIFYELPKVIRKYTGAVFRNLKPEIKEQLRKLPAYGALLTSGWRPRIGRIVFYTKNENRLTDVPVYVRFGKKEARGGQFSDKQDIEFSFGKSAKETAGEILENIVAKSDST